jgi:hypothetical protein
MTFAGALDTSTGIQVRTKLAQLGLDVFFVLDRPYTLQLMARRPAGEGSRLTDVPRLSEAETP